mmetsp:Transcript_2215/g.4702  ORF Transcript_2215/g.4702 Transcript_2215/m.4702 type:complete len:202 (+) Transcript_2215:24-629(+)|eukprot:CAMPEP_0173249742 /NCGR_PEP_ID=MMETSP1142-20121109/19186_1 /TAXON_ID=483371 /ORGANISM="non described non described, Strain CCMP2298" /LENGTH=201 /DNA_ID=CAMNT_0014182399 /DNA_START=21 /DNA_END=626 /DNA_ORIENTATION=+
MRKRSTGPSDDNHEEREEETPLVLRMDRGNPSRSISCEELLAAGPAKAGYCMKKDNSFWSYLFPCLFSQWKSRFFVVVGNFLFRFSSETGSACKGVPIPVDSASFRTLPEGVFEVSTIRKVYLIKCESEAEAAQWVAALRIRQRQSTKEMMGHAPLSPEARRANQVGTYLFEKRLRSDRKVGVGAEVTNPLDPAMLAQGGM